MESFNQFELFSNVEEVVNFLSKPEFQGVLVTELLNVYTEMLCNKSTGVKKYPLIVLEGLDGCGKTTLSRALAKRIQGQRFVTPPKSIQFLRDYFDDNPALRSAYYCLGNYIAALEISHILEKSPVIIDRFWHSTIAFALGQAVSTKSASLPELGDPIYKWPADLLTPDIIILLTVSEEKRLERHGRRNAASVTDQEKLLKNNKLFRESVIEAYKRMVEPSVAIVSSNGSFYDTLQLVLNSIQPVLHVK